MTLALLLVLTAAPYKNLQVLPKDVAKEDLMQTMRGFCFGLGVRCEDCHLPKEGGGFDFASDDKKAKKTARAMMRMVAVLNGETLPKAAGPGALKVGCDTCHRGLRVPRSLQDTLAEELDRHGLDSAKARYRELRKQYYGGAQFDFSETSLNLLAERLGREHKTKEAAAFMELNAENATLSAWGLNLLAMAHRANGEKARAIKDFQKILEVNPKDDWAKQQLDELNGAAQ